MEIPFEHHQAAHCETGVLSNLLSHHGLKISEAMVFGIGSGLFFGYFPFIRLNSLPLSAFRIATGGIMKRVTKRLGVKLKWEKFRNPETAMAALDRKLEEQVPVGCRTGAYWLSYFPRRYRFHFNMHNLVVYGKMIMIILSVILFLQTLFNALLKTFKKPGLPGAQCLQKAGCIMWSMCLKSRILKKLSEKV